MSPALLQSNLSSVGELRLQQAGVQSGLLRFSETDAALTLDLVMIPRRFRGQGFGSLLVERLLFLADRLGKPVLATARPIGVAPDAVAQSLERLVRYYSRFGFEITGRGLTVAHMRRDPAGGGPQPPGREPDKDHLLLRLALDGLPDPIVVTDRDFRVVFSNQAAQRAHLESAGTGPLCDTQSGVCVKACDARQAPCALRRAIEDGKPHTLLHQEAKATGETRSYELSAAPLQGSDGSLQGGVVLVRDATERARLAEVVSRARDAWQSTADAIPDLMLLVDGNFRILRCNRAARLFAGRGYAEIVGRDIHELFAGLCDPLALEMEQGEIRLSQPKAVLELSKYPVSLDEGGPCQAWIFRDVTVLRRLESIAGSVDMMNNMGHLLSGVRHELGNPVNSLKTALTVLLEQVERFSMEKTTTYIGRCLDDVGRIQALLDQLRTFNAFEAVSPQTTVILPRILQIASLAREQVESRGIEFECDIENDPGVLALADIRGLQQIVAGLVANAVDAVAGRPRPRIGLRVECSQTQVTLSVEDSGSGIPEQDLGLVFMPLFTTKARGTGLGLPIARNMIARMNGTIELRSQEGVGTTVEVSLTRVWPPGAGESGRDGSLNALTGTSAIAVAAFRRTGERRKASS